MQSNPVQIRIDALVEEWNCIRGEAKIRAVRILHKQEDTDMVDTFCMYLLSEDSPNPDIPILFQVYSLEVEEISESLVRELEGMVAVWNKAKLPDGSQNEPIHWRPDYHCGTRHDPAALFVKNFNALVDVLGLDEDVFLVAMLPREMLPPKAMEAWLQNALELGLAPQVRLIVSDTLESRVFDEIVAKNPDKAKVMTPELNRSGMMRQIAAMGDPLDPVVQYRKTLVVLIDAIKKRDSNAVTKHSTDCLEIAFAQCKKDSLWYGQVLVVYSLLCHDQIGNKDWKKAIAFANQGVDEMRIAAPLMPDRYFGQKFIAQAVMTRGSVYVADSEWKLASADFRECAGLYAETSDMILCIEAYRMLGFSLKKSGSKTEAAEALVEGFRFAIQLPIQTLKDTTFLGLVNLLLDCPYEKFLPWLELSRYMKESLGDGWEVIVSNWNHPNRPVPTTSDTLPQLA